MEGLSHQVVVGLFYLSVHFRDSLLTSLAEIWYDEIFHVI